MRLQRESLRVAILAAAKEEFLVKGFEKASVREIATAAGTSKSNLSNYFADKDALFCALTASAVTEFGSVLASICSDGKAPYTLEAQKGAVEAIAGFAFSHRESLQLLLFCSGGSSMEGFQKDAVRTLSDVLWKWARATAPEAAVTELFVLSVSRFYLGAIEEMLLKSYTTEQAALELPPFLAFAYGGWRAVFGE